MGKMALILVLGMAVLTSFMMIKMNSTTKQGLDTTIDMFKKTQARLTANSGVEIFLEKMRRDKSLNSGNYPGNSMVNGSYDISLAGPDSALLVTSVGHFMGVDHTTIVKTSRDDVPFPNAPAALYISTAAMQNVNMTGDFEVSGFNHDLDGNVIATTGGDIVPGIGVDNAADSVAITDVLKKNTVNQIVGLGGTPSIDVMNTGIDWQALSQQIAFSADITLGTGIYNTGTLGTMQTPKITLVNGDCTFNGNITGAGIIVVNGNLTIRGTFEFRGLIIAYKESIIQTELNGNGKVLGSMIVSGNAVDMSISNGTFSALYCKQALSYIQMNLKSSRFQILSWWE